jgi:hypothetical protein
MVTILATVLINDGKGPIARAWMGAWSAGDVTLPIYILTDAGATPLVAGAGLAYAYLHLHHHRDLDTLRKRN